MIKYSLSFLTFLFVICFCYSSAFAEKNGVETNKLNLSLGLGAAYSSNPYRGADVEITPFPLVIYQGERFFVRGIELGYHLYRQKGFTMTALGSYRGVGYDSGDSTFLQGMADRKGTFEAGLLTSFDTSFGRCRVSLLSDLLGEHKGHEAKLTLSKRFFLQNLSLSPSASLIWQSGQLANYYYGVRAAEATVNRPAYRVDNSFSLQIGMMTNYRLSERWSVSGHISLTRLADEVSDSPIVEDDFVSNAFVGIVYRL